MVLLIHHPISPFSRKVRILMSEKHILFVLKEEEPWKLSPEALKLNPAGELPIFVFDGNVISGNNGICEFLEEVHPDEPLINGDARHRAEVRRLTEWFDNKFYREVYRNIVIEKVFRRFVSGAAPDSKILKVGFNNLNFHMEYLDWLCETRKFLSGDEYSLADISAAAQLSIIDYLGDVPWEGYKNAKIWYSKIKSRPSFKEILKDGIKGILPSKHYSNLDF
ncbi:MAG: glutathione S-transferase family protein [Alphaproteobacteria bacterium]|nr:glutathione S-transferase family protein [Alphaproteobacteria bacterium]